MKRLIFFLALFCCEAQAIHTYLGTYKMLEKTQDQAGSHADNKFNPMFGVGGNFSAFWGLGFSPQLAYVHHIPNSDDSYGGDYSMRTIMMLYDFVWVPGGGDYGSRVPWAVRFGVGNFMKSIKGEGGKVTVPNGTSTIKQYRPGKRVTTYTGTFNLGADFTFNAFQDWFDVFGLRFETFMFSPLNSEKRTYAFNLLAVGYF